MKQKAPPAAPIPAVHHRTKIKHKSGDGKYKSPPSGDGVGNCEAPITDVDRPVTSSWPIPDTGDGRDI